LQAVTCIAATSQHIITGSEDSNLHIWSVAGLISLTFTETHQQIRTLSNHRAAIKSVAVGHSSSDINICVSASRDNTCIVWNYHSGELLRTFLLPSSPQCLIIDPCDRVFNVGFEDGTIQPIELFKPTVTVNSLYDSNLQPTPIQVSQNPLSGAPPDIGAVHCLGLSYDGTVLLSGHASGKVIRWDAGLRKFSAELADLSAPVTNLAILSPFPSLLSVKAVTVVKPRFGEGNYTFTGQFTSSLSRSGFEDALRSPGVPPDMLESAILELARPVMTSSAADEQLQKENEDLWAVVNEQRALQKRTYEKYLEAKASR
jgi:pre-rRNA-processing protein IPI3